MQESLTIFENTAIAFADKSKKELKREHFLFNLVKNTNLVKFGSALAEFGLKIGLPLTPLFKHTIFEHFVGGESLEESNTVIQKLAVKNIGCLINYGVEGEDSEEEFDRSLNENLNALKFAAGDPFVKAVCLKLTGIGRSDLFEKIQDEKQLTKDEEKEFARVNERLDLLCNEAYNCNTSLYIDAEEYWIQNVLDKMVLNAMRKYNKEKPVVWDTLQHYRWDQIDYLDKLIKIAKEENFVLGAKLVRGSLYGKRKKKS